MMFEDGDSHNSRGKTQKMPLYIKANEIFEIVKVLYDLVFSEQVEIESELELEEDDDKEFLIGYVEHMRENTVIILAKISGAESVELYDVKMENAAIIRKCAREIYVNCTGMEMCTFPETDYLSVLRNQIDEFRILFAEWVQKFDEWDYIIDRWGLFNPPGVNYDDHDPDDDIPFNSDDFFEN